MKSTETLSAESRRLVDTAFGGSAWLVRGTHDASDQLVVLQEGPSGTFPLPPGDDLYYCVGRVVGDRKTIGKVMVLVIDDVGKEIDKEAFDMLFPLEPSYVVESSQGSFQYGYIIRGGMEPEDYKALRRAMKSSPVWGKAHGISPAHIFRLPQGTHTKSTRGQWAVSSGSGGTWREYSVDEVWTAAPEGLRGIGATPVQGSVNDLVEDEGLLGRLVGMIPNPVENWDYFVDVGRAIWGASAGEAYDVFDAWASLLPSNDPEVTRGRWESYHDARIGRHWLLREASAADPEGVAEWLKAEARGVFDDGTVPEEDADEDDGARMIEAHQQQVADDIVRVYGDSIRFNVDTGLWHRFDGAVWAPTKAELGFQYAARWARTAAPGLKKSLAAAVQKISFPLGVEGYCRRHPKLMADENSFDQDPWLLGTPGGTVDLRTGALRAARPGDMISRCTSVTPSETEDCPFWKKHLIGWMTTVAGVPDPEMRVFLQQWAGYCLSGDTSEEKCLFLYGDGANGKGSYVDTLAALAGTYYVQPARDLFMTKKHARHAQELASLAGARMVACSEVPATADWDDGLLKDVTGGGLLSANFMRQNQFTFRVRFKVTISGNDKPSFQGRISDAIRRRFLLATFPNKANPVDPGFKPGLLKEGPGILRWAINGLVGWHKTGLMVPLSVQGTTDKYLDDEDIFGAWLKARVGKSAGAETSAQDLITDWIEYRNREGNHTLIDSQRKFADEMTRRNYNHNRKNYGVVYRDIVLKTKTNSF